MGDWKITDEAKHLRLVLTKGDMFFSKIIHTLFYLILLLLEN